MNQNDFLIWLKGFLDAIPKGQSPNWDILKEKIETVQNYSINYPDIIGVPNIYPLNPQYKEEYIITCNGTNSNHKGATTTHVITYNKDNPHTLTN